MARWFSVCQFRAVRMRILVALPWMAWVGCVALKDGVDSTEAPRGDEVPRPSHPDGEAPPNDAAPMATGDSDAGKLDSRKSQRIAAGNDATCFIKADDTLVCWGSMDKLGNPPSGAFARVSLGEEHACGVRSDGTVACWGQDSQYHQAVAPPGYFREVRAKSGGTCGLMHNGVAQCWGFGWHSAPGSGWPDGARFESIALGSSPFAIALEAGGKPHVYDADAFASSLHASEFRVTNFFMVSLAAWSACGIKTDETILCAGYDSTYLERPPQGTFRQLSLGDLGVSQHDVHACAVRTDGTLACWGLEERKRWTPPSGTFIEVSTGVMHACGIRTDGHVACWGSGPGTLVPPGL